MYKKEKLAHTKTKQNKKGKYIPQTLSHSYSYSYSFFFIKIK